MPDAPTTDLANTSTSREMQITPSTSEYSDSGPCSDSCDCDCHSHFSDSEDEDDKKTRLADMTKDVTGISEGFGLSVEPATDEHDLGKQWEILSMLFKKEKGIPYKSKQRGVESETPTAVPAQRTSSSSTGGRKPPRQKISMLARSSALPAWRRRTERCT
ncbi:hypothetical protein CLAFUW4_07965 [Fulvia fulva]|uniref:Uncharacterized protein n=1 Tax=Passalora fulva TaxID=5499 RepID=A0A9Q8LDW2_PASFU|nr:uncharacterized protein CLAFUR5_08087 [Fulvia fulva]KAK4628809.1 hypothetical protein CLAFUR4_07970 [Fulvia fulva]KAK4630321.1 hypothetical protein CLAFUR0_07967 [Fulvia fulva]UJO15597.1 hypothetical protein CLAFUR5_08087 [Fulvia fulva]WPV13014.1 hypothetical protein CLAFUW4_07965 [Fulvia fulva]WPV27608.1 hypothetical protein CLAFUW7_07966 [Fulvia fulva]